MLKWFIPAWLIDKQEYLRTKKAWWCKNARSKNKIILFDHDRKKHYYFLNVYPLSNIRAYIGERDSVPCKFRRVVRLYRPAPVITIDENRPQTNIR